MNQNGNSHKNINQQATNQTAITTPIFTPQGNTLLGVKINRPITKIAKRKFLQHCQNEASLIVSTLVLGYLQWRREINTDLQLVSLATSQRQQAIEQTLITKLRSFHSRPQLQSNCCHSSVDNGQPQLPDATNKHATSFCGSLFDAKANTHIDIIGEQLYMLTNELDPLVPKRWRPLFMHNQNAPWGWPYNDIHQHQNIGPFQPFPDGKQQIVGLVHGCCLCHHLGQSKPSPEQFTAYEWPTENMPQNPSWCIGCALYLSAFGCHCPSIHLNSIPSWIAPRQSLIPAMLNTDEKIQAALPSNEQHQIFRQHMHNWMQLGLKLLNKKGYRKKLKNVARTAKGKMIIPLMLKKLNTPISADSDISLSDASLLFEDALTLQMSTSALLDPVISKIKP